MSIAIITDDIDVGSSGTLARQLFEFGKQKGKELQVYHSRGKRRNENDVIKFEYMLEVVAHKLLTLVLGDQGCHSFFATKRLIRLMKKNNTKAVIVITLHDYSVSEKVLFNYLNEYNIKIVYITIDQYAALGKCCYANGCQNYKTGCGNCPQVGVYPQSLLFDRSKKLFRMKEQAYSGSKHIVFMGPKFNLNLFKDSPLTKNRKLVNVNWGIDLEKYKYIYDSKMFKEYNIPSEKIIILCVAPYSNAAKGVKKYFFDMARRINSDIYHFVNVGYDGNLNAEEMPSNITVIPYVKDQNELVKLYSISDLYVLPSTSDTMPLSCLIALACGVQVCCFYTSGLRYLASLDSSVVKYAKEINTESLMDVVMKTTKKDDASMRECRKYAEKNYSSKAFNNAIYDTLNSL